MSKRRTSESASKFIGFIKKQGYYILLGVCALLVATIITLSIVLGNNTAVTDPPIASGDEDQNPPKDPDDNEGGDLGDDEELKFYAPMATTTSEIFEGKYLGAYNVKCYGIMYHANKNDKVYASGDGIVIKNEGSGGKFVVSIAYADLKKVIDYYGLDAADSGVQKLKVGTQVASGSLIGTASGRYNFGGTFMNKLHVDIFELGAGNSKGDRVKDLTTLEFEQSNK